ncbi:unnamed protein product, partial [Symbiodinium sp. KB8]
MKASTAFFAFMALGAVAFADEAGRDSGASPALAMPTKGLLHPPSPLGLPPIMMSKSWSAGNRRYLTLDAPIYVAPDGDDGFDGSSPVVAKRTLSAAIAQASADTPVLVAIGEYHEEVALKGGVYVYGGFSRDFALRHPAGNVSRVTGQPVAARCTSQTDLVLDGFSLHGSNDGHSAQAVVLGDCTDVLLHDLTIIADAKVEASMMPLVDVRAGTAILPVVTVGQAATMEVAAQEARLALIWVITSLVQMPMAHLEALVLKGLEGPTPRWVCSPHLALLPEGVGMVLQGSAAVEEVEGAEVVAELLVVVTPWVVAGVAEGVEATVAAAVGEVKVDVVGMAAQVGGLGLRALILLTSSNKMPPMVDLVGMVELEAPVVLGCALGSAGVGGPAASYPNGAAGADGVAVEYFDESLPDYADPTSTFHLGPSGDCPSSWVPGSLVDPEQRCFKVITLAGASTAQEARLACQLEDIATNKEVLAKADLLTVGASEADLSIALGLPGVLPGTKPWIGAQLSTPTGPKAFQWVDGSNAGEILVPNVIGPLFDAVSPSGPDTDLSEDCLWYDVSGTTAVARQCASTHLSDKALCSIRLPASDCPPLWVRGYMSNKCFRMTDAALSRDDAERECQILQAGSQLATMRSSAEVEWMTMFETMESGDVWVGAQQVGSTEVWRWDANPVGAATGFSSGLDKDSVLLWDSPAWEAGAPNASESCVVVNTVTGKLGTRACSGAPDLRGMCTFDLADQE